MLKQRIKNYLEESGIPKTVFCRRLNISVSTIYRYLNGTMEISGRLEQSIRDYLDKFEL